MGFIDQEVREWLEKKAEHLPHRILRDQSNINKKKDEFRDCLNIEQRTDTYNCPSTEYIGDTKLQWEDEVKEKSQSERDRLTKALKVARQAIKKLNTPDSNGMIVQIALKEIKKVIGE